MSLPAIGSGSGQENWKVNFAPFNEASRASHNIKNRWCKLEVKTTQKHDKLGAACERARHGTNETQEFALKHSLEQAERIAADEGLPQEARKRAAALVEAAHENLWGYCPHNRCIERKDENAKRGVQSRVRKLVLARLKKEIMGINHFLQQQANAAAVRQLATVGATASGLANQRWSAERLSSIRDQSLKGLGSSLNELMNDTNQQQAVLKQEYDGLSKDVLAQEQRLKHVVTAKRLEIEEMRQQKAQGVQADAEAERQQVDYERRQSKERRRHEKHQQALEEKARDEKAFAAFGGVHGPVKEIDTYFSQKLFAVKKAETTFMRELPEKTHARMLARKAAMQAREALNMSEYAQLQAVDEEAAARTDALDDREQKVVRKGAQMKSAMTGDVVGKRDDIERQINRHLHTMQTVRVAQTSEGELADEETKEAAAEATRIANARAAREFEEQLAQAMQVRVVLWIHI
jgi:hypothetical protein